MIVFPPFRLDTVNQCLWRRRDSGDDERVSLPPKAFAVLRFLAERPGRLVTEEELLAAVWPGIYVQPEAIKRELYEVRRVLGDNPKATLFIESLPRRGYQFIASVCEDSTTDFTAPANLAHRRLVGRDRRLAELRDGLRKASRGQRQIVVVTGEPSMGTTALVDELQRQAALDVPGIRIARGQCINGHGGVETYSPMLEALGQLCRGPGAASIVENLAIQAPTGHTTAMKTGVRLSARERTIVLLMGHGLSNKRIARQLSITPETVKSHAKRIFWKLTVQTRAQAVYRASELGLI